MIFRYLILERPTKRNSPSPRLQGEGWGEGPHEVILSGALETAKNLVAGFSSLLKKSAQRRNNVIPAQRACPGFRHSGARRNPVRFQLPGYRLLPA
jgi:hypothetical protein